MERLTFVNNDAFAEYIANEYEIEDIQLLEKSVSINVDDLSLLEMIRLSYEVNNLNVVKYDNRYVELTCL